MERQENTKLYPQRKKNKINYKEKVIEFDIDDYFDKISKKLPDAYYNILDTNIYLYSTSRDFLNLMKNFYTEPRLEELIIDFSCRIGYHLTKVFNLVNKNSNILVNGDILKELNTNLNHWRGSLPNIYKVFYNEEKCDLFFETITDYLNSFKNLIDVLSYREIKPTLLIKNINKYYNFRLSINHLFDAENEETISRGDKSIMSYAIDYSLVEPTQLLSGDLHMYQLATIIKDNWSSLNKTLSKKDFNLRFDHFYSAKDKFNHNIKRIYFAIFKLSSHNLFN